MGFDMRGNNGRCPPFLLGGCILLCIVLTCNWWSISSQNYDLIKQIDILEEQMRICFRERDQCLSERSKLETNVAQLNINNDEQKVEKDAIIKRRDKELTLCTTELESLKNLDASKTESLNTLRTDLDEKKEEIKRLNEKIKFVTLAMKELKNHEQVSKVADDKTKDDGGGTDNKEINDDVGLALDNKGTTELSLREKDGERDVQMANE